MPSGPHGMLTRGEARKALKKLRALGVKPPRMGYCVTVIGGSASTSVELCRHPPSRYHAKDSGYQIVTLRREHGLFGAHKPTIYEALRAKLKRTPTNSELRTEVDRIKSEAYAEVAARGGLRHQRRRR